MRACVRAKWAESRRAFTGPPITVIMQSSGRDKSVNGKAQVRTVTGPWSVAALVLTIISHFGGEEEALLLLLLGACLT